MAAKAAVRDVGRVMGLQSEADRVARLIPTGPNVTIDGALERCAELRQIYEHEPADRDSWSTWRATWRARCAAPASTRRACVISREPLETVVPLQLRDYKDPNPWLVSQYEQAHLEELGPAQVRLPRPLEPDHPDELRRSSSSETRGIEIDLDRLPTDDAKTYALLGAGRDDRRLPARIGRDAPATSAS